MKKIISVIALSIVAALLVYLGSAFILNDITLSKLDSTDRAMMLMTWVILVAIAFGAIYVPKDKQKT